MAKFKNDIHLPECYNSQLEEKKILKFWDKNNILKKIQSARQEQNNGRFVIHNGPTFPIGSPHVGHYLDMIVLDVFTRYGHQRNRQTEDVMGWNCHGLPVEHIVNQKLKIRFPRDIDKTDISAYHKECRDFVLRNIDDYKITSNQLGNCIDFSKEYYTMSLEQMEKVWKIFKELLNKDLVYRGTKVLPYCTGCRTHISTYEAEENFKSVSEVAYTIGVDIVNSNEKLLIWTTNPWTLASNVAVCVNPHVMYIKVRSTRARDENVVYLLAKSCIENVFKDRTEYVVLEEMPGETLKHIKYKPPFAYVPDTQDRCVLLDETIAQDIGTGLCPIDEVVTHSLNSHECVLNSEIVSINKPHCRWTNTPLTKRAVSSWFIKTKYITPQVQEMSSQIHWLLNETDQKSFTEWLQQQKTDWSISRCTIWGTPIPIWKSESGDEVICIESIDELQQLTGIFPITDLHRQSIDEIEIPSKTPGNPPLRRIPDVFDCWFEAAATSLQRDSVDLAIQEVDQIRTWAFTSFVLSTSMSQSPPYRNIFTTGLIVEQDGSKVLKPKHNNHNIMRLQEKYGADAVRLYVLSSPLVESNNFIIQETGVVQIVNDVIKPLYRIFSECTKALGDPSWTNYGLITTWQAGGHVCDKWIVSYTESLQLFYCKEMDAYRLHNVIPRISELLHQIEVWYLPMRRSSLKEGEAEVACLLSLFNVIYRCCLMLAPFAPFITEYIYQIYRSYIILRYRKDSIHENIFYPHPSVIQPELELSMKHLQTAVELVQRIRTKNIIPKLYKIKEVIIIHRSNSYLGECGALNETALHLFNAHNVRLCNDHREFGATLKISTEDDYIKNEMDSILQALNDNALDLENWNKTLEAVPQNGIQVSYLIDNCVAESTAAATEDDLIVVVKMNKPLSYYREGTLKDLDRHINRVKRAANYFPSQQAIIYYSTDGLCLQTALTKYKMVLNRSINCDLRWKMDATIEVQKDLIEKDAIVKGHPLKLYLVCDTKKE